MVTNKSDIVAVRAEIFRLARRSKNIEIMHWYMWLDECFENDELPVSHLSNMQWRVFVLRDLHEPVSDLIFAITLALRARGYLGPDGSLRELKGSDEETG